MGYYTYYTLHVKGIRSKEECESIIDEISNLESNCLYFDDEPKAGSIVMYSNDTCKWYDSTEDMLKISKNHPHCAFLLEGEGEDREDFWREYYLDGKSDYCPSEIVFKEPTLFDWDHFSDVTISAPKGDEDVYSNI